MLTGICFCADCGGAMTIRTGKSRRYRYYTCSIAARQVRPDAREARSRWSGWTIWSQHTWKSDP
jgi:Recombinase zinc beta ribbon domain